MLRESEREIVAANTEAHTRSVAVRLDRSNVVWIGDLASEPTAVALYDASGAEIASWADAAITAAMTFEPIDRQKDPWRPIIGVRFRPGKAVLGAGFVLKVTGVWGFPMIPEDVQQACVETVSGWFQSRHMAEDAVSHAVSRRLSLQAVEVCQAYRMEFI